ncbi:Protein MANNAN SYNTHESIS-RELATED 1 [Hirschfeldia incana]|nr:Protein MANNAN SYNTHESIS-RELATED 1 [Hirschfeldia incana]
MGIDLRQVVAGILTITMFVMLGQMLHRDYFDAVQVQGDAHDIVFHGSKVALEEDGLVRSSEGPWMENSHQLKPCWSISQPDEEVSSKGYVTFSLTNGPEYHISQITDAVMVAKHLGATLVLPDIRGSKPGDEMNFEDIYDADKLVKSLESVVKVVKKLPSHVSLRDIAIVKVPTRVAEDYIKEHIDPIFKSKGNIRVTTYFPSVNLRKSSLDAETDPVSCLAMFGSLELQPGVNDLVESMVQRLKTHSKNSGGRFIAIDLRVEILEKKNCRETGAAGSKTCYNAQEIALFLRKLGFGSDTTIYLTQPRWESSLNILKDIFPKTFTKEAIVPEDKKSKYLELENSEYENVIDFYISSRSDVFVPAIPGLFYANTVGKRISLGKPQVLVPAEISGTSGLSTDYISPYISKKNHLAYSCFC